MGIGEFVGRIRLNPIAACLDSSTLAGYRLVVKSDGVELPPRRGRHIKHALAATAAGAAVLLAASIWFGGRWAAADHKKVAPPPLDFPARSVEFSGGNGVLRGWFAPGHPGGAAVALMHGSHQTRRAMLGRARFLHEHGYATLLFDFHAYGQSEGDRNTFGFTEADDAAAAVRLLRSLAPGERVGALGFSLGAAACVLGEKPLDVDALVLEALYPDIENAVANRLRLRLGPLGPALTPLLTWQIYPRWGIRLDQLRPIDGIRRVRAPVLLIAGADDPRTPVAESKRLFAAASEPKELWIVPGAGHANFQHFAPKDYEARVLPFLARFLRNH